jgi:hypothetical protein
MCYVPVSWSPDCRQGPVGTAGQQHPTGCGTSSRRANWKQLRRRYLTGVGLWPEQDGVTLFNPAAVKITRYRYRRDRISSPWTAPTTRAIG